MFGGKFAHCRWEATSTLLSFFPPVPDSTAPLAPSFPQFPLDSVFFYSVAGDFNRWRHQLRKPRGPKQPTSRSTVLTSFLLFLVSSFSPFSISCLFSNFVFHFHLQSFCNSQKKLSLGSERSFADSSNFSLPWSFLLSFDRNLISRRKRVASLCKSVSASALLISTNILFSWLTAQVWPPQTSRWLKKTRTYQKLSDGFRLCVFDRVWEIWYLICGFRSI